MPLAELNNKDLLEAAVDVAREGGNLTLNYFREELQVETKKDQTPVTEADRQAEQKMRVAIKEKFPAHGIIGEEFDNHNPDSSIQWILDPIDGTFSFIHGFPTYTTLIGVVIDDKPEIGVVYAPALREMYEAAIGEGTRVNGKECRVRSCSSLDDATFLSTDVVTPEAHDFKESFRSLLLNTEIHRTWGDAYGHMMVASGRADLMFDPVLNIWDAAPLLPILKEAGGIFCDVTGKETIQTGNGISCSKELLPEVLKVFK